MAGYLRWRDGAWRLRVDAGPDPVTGRRRQVHRTIDGPNNKTGRKRAEIAIARLVTETNAQRAIPRSGITVADLLERYIAHRAPAWSPGSADATRARIAQHIIPTLGPIALDQLRPVDIDRLYAGLRAVGLSGSSLARLHDVLRAALRQAVRWDLITASPVDRIDPPTRNRSEITPPTPAQVAALIAAADPTLALYVRLAAVTGARRGQLVALRWTAIDPDTSEIRFTTALAKVAGGVVEKSTKTGARYTISIDPGTRSLLRDHRRRQAEAALALGIPLTGDAYLFATDPPGTQPWHPDGASQRFARLRAKVGLDHVRLHDLRHWMATQLLADGYDIVEVAGRGGWSNTTTPLEVYAHFQPAKDRQAAASLGQALDRT